jgi:hypothetical protein
MPTSRRRQASPLSHPRARPVPAIHPRGHETVRRDCESDLGRAAIDSDEALEVRKHTFARTVPDYEDVVGQVHVPLPPHVAQYLRTAASGVAVGYFLAKRLDLLDWVISDLGPARALEKLAFLACTIERQRLLASVAQPANWAGWMAYQSEQFLELGTVDEIEAAMDLGKLYTFSPSTRPH